MYIRLFPKTALLLFVLMCRLSGCSVGGNNTDSALIDEKIVPRQKENLLDTFLKEKQYNTLTFNNHLWLAQDLRETTFRNGDPIPQASSAAEWQKAAIDKSPVWCFLDYDENNADQGLYYNWYAVNDPRGLAPEGWEIVPNRIFYQMARELNFDAWHIKADEGWKNRRNIYNSTGFSAYPTGLVTASGGFFSTDNSAYWWTSTEKNAENAMYMMIYEDSSFIIFRDLSKEYGMVVRCYKPLQNLQAIENN